MIKTRNYKNGDKKIIHRIGESFCSHRYNKNGLLISYKTNGYFFIKKYDKNGNLIFYKNSNGISFKKIYDSLNRLNKHICLTDIIKKHI